MSHGNSDVMEAQPLLALPVCEKKRARAKERLCVCVSVLGHRRLLMGSGGEV